jgi:glycosyltransferase involved in cell wall biosynthesis
MAAQTVRGRIDRAGRFLCARGECCDVRLLVIGYEGHPSTRLRVLQYLDALRGDGVESTAVLVPQIARSDPRRNLTVIRRHLRSADVVLVQRVLTRWLNLLLRAGRKPVVFDLDDAVHYIRPAQLPATLHPSRPADRGRALYRRLIRGSKYYSSRKALLDEMLGLSRAVIFGNAVLENELAGRARGEHLVLPTSVPVPRDELKVHENHAPVTIGWVGVKDNLTHLRTLEPVFSRLRERFGEAARLSVVTSEEYRSDHLPTDFTRWSLESEADLVRTFDIGIMPLIDDPFSRGKCAFKAILCMSHGIPVVVSRVGANAELVRDGWNGFLASTQGEWDAALVQLASDHELRARMGRNAYETIEDGYSIERAYPVLRDVLLRAGAASQVAFKG